MQTDNLDTKGVKVDGRDIDVNGWGFYVDDGSVDQEVTSTESKLLINGLGSTSNESFLPSGNTSMWSVDDDKITPFIIGATYSIRIQLDVMGLTGNPTQMHFVLDIGGGATPTIPIFEQTITLKNNVPQSIVVSSPVFCLSTFVTNGGQIFFSTNTGSLTIDTRSILLVRTS